MKKSAQVFGIWLAVALFYFYAFIARSSFVTVLAHDFMQFFKIDAAGLSILTSCYYWVYTFMQIPAGIILDKYSIKTVGSLMGFSTSIGVLLLVLTSNFYLACLSEMLIAFGSSFVFVFALKIISTYFPKHKIAIMTSYTISLGVCGPVVGGPLVSAVSCYVDWRHLVIGYGILGVAFAMLLRYVVLGHAPEPQSSTESSQEEKIPVFTALKKVVASPVLWVLGLYTMALYGPLSALGDLWGVSLVSTLFGIDRIVAAVIGNMLYVGVLVGSPCTTYLAYKMGSYKKVMVLSTISVVLLLGSMVVFPKLPTPIIFAIFFLTGFCCGSMFSYALGLLEFPASMGGCVTSFINMMSMVSGIILMPGFSFFLKLQWNGAMENGVPVYSPDNFRLALLAVVIFCAIGIVTSLLVKDSKPAQADA